METLVLLTAVAAFAASFVRLTRGPSLPDLFTRMQAATLWERTVLDELRGRYNPFTYTIDEVEDRPEGEEPQT